MMMSLWSVVVVLLAVLNPSLGWAPLPSQRRLRLSSALSASTPFQTLSSSTVVAPKDGSRCRAVDDGLLGKVLWLPDKESKVLVVVMPQLGDFDSSEYAELLLAVLPDLNKAKIKLRIIGIGDVGTARKFSSFAGLPLDLIRVDPTGKLHEALGCHRGPNWDIPSYVPDSLLLWFADYVGAAGTDDMDVRTARGIARSWLNYMAMCAGIAAPGTLQEIFRGYVGDKSAPERLRDDETITAGPISVTGVKDVKLGPIEYQSLWKKEEGYQRPAELATVRLRAMVEVLTNFGEYVPDQRYLDWRGATFLFDSDGEVEYSYMDKGVLTYSATMPRPLSYLAPYIGEERAKNPLGLADPLASTS
jgi:hypothetical protein